MDIASVVLMVERPGLSDGHRLLAPEKALKDDIHGRVKRRLRDRFVGQLVELGLVVDGLGLLNWTPFAGLRVVGFKV